MQPSALRFGDGAQHDLEEEICAIVAAHLGVARASITCATNFEELGADISDLAEMVVSVEEAFGIQIRDEEVDRLLTVGDLIAQVKPVWFPPNAGGGGSVRT
jgi:acyl carrier protein